ncbi:MAG: hypothetical protein QMD85_02830 [Candidatus Aenigmarchaeota archaeon]|nr:hypothetical protein [Candidatus Aenigmarchaeota archaeon]MDI6722483.1 hypothetical protein [Candidatus Aenigmarchaeota archaeon]
MKDVGWRIEYDKLWLKLKNKEFMFEDALSVIFGKRKISTKEIKYASKLLNLIEDNGFSISFRAEHDQRARIYRLLAPEKVSNARAILAILHKTKGFSDTDIPKEACCSAKWNYVYIKDSAIGFWTNNYRSVDVKHISVLREDVDGWIALLKLCNYSVVVDGVVVFEKERAIYLHSNLDMIKNQAENHYQMPHYTIIDSLKSDFNGALAVLVMQRNKINWNELIKLAELNGLINILGFILETTNKQAKKQIFPKKTIQKIEKKKRADYEIIEGIETKKGKEYWVDVEYKELQEKWRVKCYQPDAIRKIVEDLL